MKKLSLSLDALQVQTFRTEAPVPGGADREPHLSFINFTFCSCTCPPWH